jgi:hypothetical protein
MVLSRLWWIIVTERILDNVRDIHRIVFGSIGLPSWFHSSYHQLQYEITSEMPCQNLWNGHVYQVPRMDVLRYILICQRVQHRVPQRWRKEEKIKDPIVEEKQEQDFHVIRLASRKHTRFPTWGRAWITVSRRARMPLAIFNNFNTKRRFVSENVISDRLFSIGFWTLWMMSMRNSSMNPEILTARFFGFRPPEVEMMIRNSCTAARRIISPFHWVSKVWAACREQHHPVTGRSNIFSSHSISVDGRK